MRTLARDGLKYLINVFEASSLKQFLLGNSPKTVTVFFQLGKVGKKLSFQKCKIYTSI